MDERATGLILRTHPLTETSLIVHWLSLEVGRVATVAKGARRPNSPLRGKLDLFYEAEFSFARSRRSELHPLREVVLRDIHPALRREIGWLQQAAYAAGLIEQITETETPMPELFDWFQQLLAYLPAQPKTPVTVLALEVKLLALLGWPPNWPQERLTPGTRALLERLEISEWSGVGLLRFSPAQTAEAAGFLKRHILKTCERVPAKREVALAGPEY